MNINLFINHYKSPRRHEFEECAYRNAALMKVHITHQKEKPTFAQMFEQFIDGEINIVANADIYWTKDSVLWLHGLTSDDCWALTRWDAYTGEFFNRRDAQDVFCFLGKIKPGNYDFQMGKGGCDNRLVYELMAAGYNVTNPSLTVKTFHLHKEESREWHSEEQVPPPYEFCYPTKL